MAIGYVIEEMRIDGLRDEDLARKACAFTIELIARRLESEPSLSAAELREIKVVKPRVPHG